MYEEILRPRNSGSEGKPIVFRSFKGEKVVISAMQEMGGWEPDGGEVFRTSVDWDLGQENLILAEGVVCDLARWPDKTADDPFDLGVIRNTGGSDKTVIENAYLEYAPGLPDFP